MSTNPIKNDGIEKVDNEKTCHELSNNDPRLTAIFIPTGNAIDK
jgi:hypothetical protein